MAGARSSKPLFIPEKSRFFPVLKEIEQGAGGPTAVKARPTVCRSHVLRGAALCRPESGKGALQNPGAKREDLQIAFSVSPPLMSAIGGRGASPCDEQLDGAVDTASATAKRTEAPPDAECVHHRFARTHSPTERDDRLPDTAACATAIGRRPPAGRRDFGLMRELLAWVAICDVSITMMGSSRHLSLNLQLSDEGGRS